MAGEMRLLPYISEVVCSLSVVGVEAKGACILLTDDGKITAVDADDPRTVGVECNPAGTGIFGVRLNQLPQDVRSIFFVATLSKRNPGFAVSGAKGSTAKSFKGMTSANAGLKCPGRELCTVSLSPYTDGNAIVFLAIYKEAGAPHHDLNSHRGGWRVEAVAKCYHCFNGDAYQALQPSLERLTERGLDNRPLIVMGATGPGICNEVGVPQICIVEQDLRPPDESLEIKPIHPKQSAERPYAATPVHSPRGGGFGLR